MRVLIVDNYDSFTFNLYQHVGELLQEKNRKFSVDVYRNDKIDIATIKNKKYDKIILSPGPGDPRDKAYFGICADILIELGKTIPILGVCLGMQGIAFYFGGDIIKAKAPMHGKTSMISHDGKGIFKNIPQRIAVMRYHSLVADAKKIPAVLKVTATAIDTNEVMGLRHKYYPIEGIQFHPESFATEAGKILLKNFLFS